MFGSITQMFALAVVVVLAAMGMEQTTLPLTGKQFAQTPLVSEKSDMERFMDAVAHRESKGNHRVVNQLGMMGKYQFSRTTLRLLRKDITPKQFLQNPHIQDTVMLQYLRVNNTMLDPIISKYEGKTFKGIKITRSGILAAAHLGGAGSVLSWFRNPSEAGLVDANGTSIREYMSKFAGYSIGRNL